MLARVGWVDKSGKKSNSESGPARRPFALAVYRLIQPQAGLYFIHPFRVCTGLLLHSFHSSSSTQSLFFSFLFVLFVPPETRPVIHLHSRHATATPQPRPSRPYILFFQPTRGIALASVSLILQASLVTTQPTITTSQSIQSSIHDPSVKLKDVITSTKRGENIAFPPCPHSLRDQSVCARFKV